MYNVTKLIVFRFNHTPLTPLHSFHSLHTAALPFTLVALAIVVAATAAAAAVAVALKRAAIRVATTYAHVE